MAEAPLTLDDFEPLRGKSIDVEAADVSLQLVFAEAQNLPGSVRDGGGFRLEFEGPLDPELGQGICRFSIPGRAADIFIVPIERRPAAMRYEAIFF